MIRLFIIFVFCQSLSDIFSQQKDSIQILQEVDSVYVSGSKIIITLPPNKETKFDLEENKKMVFNTLEKVLDNQSNISLKKYGEGQISTISVKGFNASQTDLVWNGVNINSPLLGQADVSTISVGNNTQLQLTENNSNNIAGAVSLRNIINYYQKPQLKVSSAISSFGNFQQGISFETNKNNTFYSNSNLSVQYNFNHFKYTSKALPNEAYIYLENGETMNFHFEQVNGYKFTNNNELNVFVKAFYADRNIAPTIYEFSSTKNQKDELYLAKLNWRKYDSDKNYNLNISSSFVNQQQAVKLSKASTPIEYGSNTWQTDLAFQKQLINKMSFNFKLNNILESGYSNNFDKNVLRNRLLLKSNFYYQLFQDFSFDIGLAEILVDSKFSQPLPSIELKYTKENLPASILLQFDYNRKSRFPSLNDLYWNPGGNPNLEEEYSHNFNFNFVVERHFKPFQKNNKWHFKNKVEFFQILAENYIQWQPTAKGFWEPNNIGKVHSRGFTNNFTLGYTLNKNWRFQNVLSFNFTRITKQGEMEQLVYAPMTNLYNQTKLSLKWFDFIINQQYVSEKFTNYNNTLAIDKFYLLDLIVSREFSIKDTHKLYLALEAHNILNETYYTYINRALPKRNFALKLKYTFN